MWQIEVKRWSWGDSNLLPSRFHRDALASSYEVKWWANLDSNQGPQSYQDCALTS